MTVPSARMSLDSFFTEVGERIRSLRSRLEEAAPRKARTLEEAWKIDGQVFVAAIGSIVNVVNHETEFFYIPAILPARDLMLDQLRASRQRLFDGIATQLGAPRRVLVIGAGGDVRPIESLRRRSHEIIATDFAEDVVEVLRKKADVRAFACDLVHLDRILPEPVDAVVANSTLGYIDPAKLATVVRNVTSAVTLGGVFTFDLTPHPQYFNMALGATQQTVANESSPDPRRLIALVREHGVGKGIAAATLESGLASLAVNLAIVALLKRRFEAEGLQCSTGEYTLESASGALMTSLILRVSRRDGVLLEPLSGEVAYDDPLEALQRQELNQLSYFLPCLDRATGEELAKEFGIHRSSREDAWLIPMFLKGNPAETSHYGALLPEVMSRLDPNVLANRIDEYVNGRAYVAPSRLPVAVLFDQYTRKMVFQGVQGLTVEEADFRIDLGYQRAHANPSISYHEIASPPASFVRASTIAQPRKPATKIKVGRNDPCPCGSGVKYKKCHGND